MHTTMLLVLFCICFCSSFAAVAQSYETSDEFVHAEALLVVSILSAYSSMFREPRVTSALSILKKTPPYSLPFEHVTRTAPPAWFTQAPSNAQSVYLSMQTAIDKVIDTAGGVKANAAPEPTAGTGKLAVAGLVMGAMAML